VCRGSACDGSSADARLQIARAGLGIGVLPPLTPGGPLRVADQGQLIADNRLLRNVGSITTDESNGNSSYHAMQLWLNRRFSDKLAFQVAYTWGHAISDVALTSFTNTTSDPFNFASDKGDADLDRRHTFVSNVVYVLPSFKKWGKAAEFALGDWQLNAIGSYFGATPVDITDGANTLGTASAVGQRPNYTGAPLYLSGDPTRHLNPAAFATPAPGQLGTLGKGAVRGVPITNIDFSMSKNWRFKERYGFQFRAEFFNIFNHPNFSLPGRTINQPTFGVINSVPAGSARLVQFGLKLIF